MKFGSITTGIIADGLVFNMDAANRASYPKTGTTVTDTISKETGSLINNTFFIDAPTSASCWSFDQTDDSIDIGSPTSIQSLTPAITIGSWFKAPRTFSQNYYTLASKGTYAAAGSQWSIQINTANERNTAGGTFQTFSAANGIDGRENLSFPTPVDDNQWHYMVFINDGTDLKVYIDGVLDATGTGQGSTLYNGDRTLKLGMLTSGTTQELLGEIANIHIYNRALSSNEVLHNYNALKGRFGLT